MVTQLKKEKMPKGEIFLGLLFVMLFYALLGICVGLVIDALNPTFGFNDFVGPQRVAYLIFWPVFLIKYLGIGTWNVLVAFWHLITL